MLHDSTGRVLARRHPAGVLCSGLILAVGLAGGCDSIDPSVRQAVSGIVTLDGQPIVDGAILLERPSPDDAPWMAVGATIRSGACAIARERGPNPGTYRVRIDSSTGAQATPATVQDERTRRPMAERLPAIYNANSELRVAVTAEGPNRFRFELHSATGS